jgi:hypothetical protein
LTIHPPPSKSNNPVDGLAAWGLASSVAATTEQIAIWILAALKTESELNSSLLTCRTESEVLGPLKSKHKIGDSDLVRGINFLVERRMLNAVVRSDGRATLPSDSGFQYLATHSAAEKANGWTLDHRLKVYAILVSIVGVLLSYTIWRLSK